MRYMESVSGWGESEIDVSTGSYKGDRAESDRGFRRYNGESGDFQEGS